MPRRKEESDSESDEESMKKSQKGNRSGDKLRWVNWVKEWSKDHNKTYGCALSDPSCSGEYNEYYGIKRKSYRKNEGDNARTKRAHHFAGEKALEKDRMTAKERIARRKANDDNMTKMEEEESKRRATKLANEKSMERGEMPFFRSSTPRLLVKQNIPLTEPVKRPAPARRPKGRGVTAISSAEDTNGLTHIYPLFHGQILKMSHF